MDKFSTIQHEWKKYFDDVSATRGFYRLKNKTIAVAHYKELLKQIYFHTRENPQIQALSTVYFRGRKREVIKSFYRHAISEIGHDQLALDDLKTLGEDVSQIHYQRPQPATMALLSYAFYGIQHGHPLSYLGYLFHLEFMPTQNGHAYMEQLQDIGVTSKAMSFILEHATVDITHNRWMQEYVEKMVQTQEELDMVIYSSKVTALLYANMVHDAFEYADRPQTNWGIEPQEKDKFSTAIL